MRTPVRVAVTGAAGQIGYSLLFRIARGDLLGPDTPVHIHLIELEPALDAARGVVMELDDCAFPLLAGCTVTSNLDEGFGDVDIAMLVGAKPRGPGMERADLLMDNAKIFTAQGAAIDRSAKEDVKVVVVGNPCNTNCLIAASKAHRTNPANYTAMTRLDQNRARAQLAAKAGAPITAVQDLVIWGNHSPTMFPDFAHARIGDAAVTAAIPDHGWLQGDFLTTVQKRGAAIIQARGKSSAASAASAAIDHIHDWALGTTDGGRWTSMAVRSGGEYGIPEGLYFSYPIRLGAPWAWTIDTSVELDAFAQAKVAVTTQELVEERDAIRHLL